MGGPHTRAESSPAVVVVIPRKPVGCTSEPNLVTEPSIAGHVDCKRCVHEVGANAISFGTNAPSTALIQEYMLPGRASRRRKSWRIIQSMKSKPVPRGKHR